MPDPSITTAHLPMVTGDRQPGFVKSVQPTYAFLEDAAGVRRMFIAADFVDPNYVAGMPLSTVLQSGFAVTFLPQLHRRGDRAVDVRLAVSTLVLQGAAVTTPPTPATSDN